MADKVGVARVTYTAYERGTKTPPLETVAKIANVLGVSTDYLLDVSDGAMGDKENESSSMRELNALLEKYEIDDMAFFDIEKWRSMSPEQIRQLESYFQYLVDQSKKYKNNDK